MGQTEITGHCNGLMPKNGEHNVLDFAVVIYLYGVSHRLLINLIDLHWKPLACFGLCMDTVPMVYSGLGISHSEPGRSSTPSLVLGSLEVFSRSELLMAVLVM
jgi:hypothetical protein